MTNTTVEYAVALSAGVCALCGCLIYQKEHLCTTICWMFDRQLHATGHLVPSCITHMMDGQVPSRIPSPVWPFMPNHRDPNRPKFFFGEIMCKQRAEIPPLYGFNNALPPTCIALAVHQPSLRLPQKSSHASNSNFGCLLNSSSTPTMTSHPRKPRRQKTCQMRGTRSGKAQPLVRPLAQHCL